MQSNMFKSVNELSKTVTVRKQSETGEKVEWVKIQWIRVCKAEPLKMFYKYSVQEDVEFSCVNFAKKGRKCKNVTCLRLLHPQQRPLSADKVKDLHKLLKYIPPIHHDFYNRLLDTTVDRPICF